MRRVKFWVTLLLGCLCSMGISFLLVRHMTQNLILVERVNPEIIHAAQLLRATANSLAALTQEYLDRFPLEQAAPTPQISLWIERDFKPRARTLARDLEWQSTAPGANALTRGPVFASLLEAARKLTSSASHPTDAGLRGNAIRDIRRALEAAETHIASLKAGSYIMEPPFKLKP